MEAKYKKKNIIKNQEKATKSIKKLNNFISKNIKKIYIHT